MKKLRNFISEVKRRRNPTNGRYSKILERLFYDFLDARDKYQRYIENFGWDQYFERMMREMKKDFNRLPLSVSVEDVYEAEFDGRPDMDEDTEVMRLTFEVVCSGKPTEDDADLLYEYLVKNKESNADLEGIDNDSIIFTLEIV